MTEGTFVRLLFSALALILLGHCSSTLPAIGTSPLSQVEQSINLEASPNDIVVFNTNSRKYHIPSCTWAKRCTKNCIKIKRSEAKNRGGVPCKVCEAWEY